MKRNQEEHLIQCGIVDWYNRVIGDELLMAIPNGGARSVVTGAMLKREGVRSGVWDLFLPVPMCTKDGEIAECGLWIEVKIPKVRNHARGGCSEKQEKFGQTMRRRGYSTVIVYTTEEGISAIRRYLSNSLTAETSNSKI
ncbi:MAG: hypothetical protein OQK82_01200 [Candidatus Pacearchaeota archaeon]|nr:hypothetical protein [Candidatus Pacearchaeota archaeon]